MKELRASRVLGLESELEFRVGIDRGNEKQFENPAR